jgi:enamine deaminase RidA (YjgF/YER057c/UK114 family)
VIESFARRAIWPASVSWHGALGSSPAVAAGGWVFTSNHLPTDYEDPIAPQAAVDPRCAFGASALEREADLVLATLAATLAGGGCDLRADAARMHWWLRSDRPTAHELASGSTWTGIEDLTPIHEARERCVARPQPGSTGIGVRELLSAPASLATAAIGIQRETGWEKQGVDAPSGMAQIPDTPAVRFGDWVFTVGVIASDWRGDFMTDRHMGPRSFVDPRARVNPYVWFGSAVEAQVESIRETLSAIAAQAGTTLDRCVKAEVYFGQAQDLHAIERAWRRCFPRHQPARTLVPCAGLAGMGCRVEIALVLLAGDAPIDTVETSAAPEPVWHESQAVRAGDFLFLSTQLAIDSHGRVPDRLAGRGGLRHLHEADREQARFVVENIAAICEAGGTSLQDVCRRATFYGDLGDFAGNAAEWRRHFDANALPAAIDVGLGAGAALLAPDARMVTDVVAYAPRQRV